MHKNFDQWNEVKKGVDNSGNFPNFREREVWFVNLGLNVGYEQNGKGSNYLRPVIIFKKFNYRLFWAVPLTKNVKNHKYYFNFKINSKENSAILSQLRILDVKRLRYKIGYLSKKNYLLLTKKILGFFPKIF